MFLVAQMRRLTYWLGFDPKLGTILHSPSRSLQNQFAAWHRNFLEGFETGIAGQISADTAKEALDLDAIQKRADAATAGSWWTGMKDGFSYTVEGPEADSHPVAQRLIRPDAEFIVHAREDVPALVAALRSRDAEVAELKAKIAELTQEVQDADSAIAEAIVRGW